MIGSLGYRYDRRQALACGVLPMVTCAAENAQSMIPVVVEDRQ